MVSRFYKISNAANIKEQQGVVLVVSLVFLIALTAAAAALMQNTTTDLKMSGASEDKVIATQEVVSAVDEYIFRQVTGGSGNNAFKAHIATFSAGPIDIVAALTRTNNNGKINAASLDITNNQYHLQPDCSHLPKAKATEVGEVSCNLLKIQISRNYGRKSSSVVQVNSGIAQIVLKP